MTPLKAIEAIQAVRFVPATKYPTNVTCANPECDKEGESDHHIFGRGKGENSDSYFVLVPVLETPEPGGPFEAFGPESQLTYAKKPIPHVVRLCGHGTAGCHGDVEAHNVWIRYEDGAFNWYVRITNGEYELEEVSLDGVGGAWRLVGPLNPQPFNWGEKRKKPKKRKSATERETRRTISLSVPQGFAEGGRVWDEHFGNGKDDKPLGWVRVALGAMREEPIDPEHGLRVDKRPEFELIIDALHNWREAVAGR